MSEIDWDKEIDSIATDEDLADFIGLLCKDLTDNRDDWENPELARYLAAMEAWVRDFNFSDRGADIGFPKDPHWKSFASLLYAAKIYE